jgi:hypothetical protein
MSLQLITIQRRTMGRSCRRSTIVGTFIFNAYEAFLNVQQVAGQHLL